MDERAYEQPPTGWYSNDEWSVGVSSGLSPRSYLALGFGLALFVTTLMMISLMFGDLEPKEIGGLIGLYLIGAVFAFMTPVRPRDNKKAEFARYAWVGLLVVGLLRVLDRIGDSYPVVDAGLACVLSLACGWFALLMVRYGFENRRRGLRSQTQPPPASDSSAR